MDSRLRMEVRTVTEDEYNKSIAFRAIMRTIVQTQPDTSVTEAYDLAIATEERLRSELEVEAKPDPATKPGPKSEMESDLAYYARWCRWIDASTSDEALEIRDHMARGKKINAIKDLRAASLMGLKEAKETIELWERGGHLS